MTEPMSIERFISLLVALLTGDGEPTLCDRPDGWRDPYAKGPPVGEIFSNRARRAEGSTRRRSAWPPGVRRDAARARAAERPCDRVRRGPRTGPGSAGESRRRPPAAARAWGARCAPNAVDRRTGRWSW